VREHFKPGMVLFRKNDVPVCFYVIESGKVNIMFNDPSKKDIVLGSKESFGESVFKPNTRRLGTAVVMEDLTCLTINETKMR
jgi:CRP-like cAMP-binding protein